MKLVYKTFLKVLSLIFRQICKSYFINNLMVKNKGLLIIILVLVGLTFNLIFIQPLVIQEKTDSLIIKDALNRGLSKAFEDKSKFLEEDELSLGPKSIKDSLTNIDGIYYLRDYDPLNYSDEGSFNRIQPIRDEIVKCGMWILYHFNQPGVYREVNNITNIYYYLWQNSPGNDRWGSREMFNIGYSITGEHSAPYDEFVIINTSNYIAEVNEYRLVQTMIFPNQEIANFNGDEIYNFTIRYAGGGPMIIGNKNMPSFIILNLENNKTLKGYDRDGDRLNDYDELFVYITNPFNNNTDGDLIIDYSEVIGGTDPNNYLDF